MKGPRAGEGRRRGLRARPRDRRGPHGLGRLLRAAREREDDSRPHRRGRDRGSVRGAVGSLGIGRRRSRRARAGDRAAGRRRPADDPLPRRDPPLQQGAAGRAPARGGVGPAHADRSDDGEPVLRGQLGAPLAHAGLRARAADRRRPGRDRPAGRGAPRRGRPGRARRPDRRPRLAATRATRSTSSSSPGRPRSRKAQRSRSATSRTPRAGALSSTTRAGTPTTTSPRPSSRPSGARIPTLRSTTSPPCSREARTRATSPGA